MADKTRDASVARFSINLGGIVIGLSAADKDSRFEVDPARMVFSSFRPPQVALRVHRVRRLPAMPAIARAVFDSKGLWSLIQAGRRYILDGRSDAEGKPDIRLILSADLSRGDVYVSRRSRPPQKSLPYPLGFPLDEILTILLLSSRRGLLVHACAVSRKGRGLLFVGESGAGKSTLARLHQKKRGAVVLNDDRVIIRRRGRSLRLHGTPWHGDAGVCSRLRAPLDRVFFIKHGAENSLRKLSKAQAVSSLIASSFAPFWDKRGMEAAVEVCARLADAVPCRELAFLPDETVLDFLDDKT